MSVTEIKESYAKYADWIHRFDWLARLVTGRYRRTRFEDVDGKVLDVACGTGTNFQYLGSVEILSYRHFSCQSSH
jgi:2-polyprenyl-3-methyl-5-hydroxy-6-metoxy-1,4-benzoquinol methylase